MCYTTPMRKRLNKAQAKKIVELTTLGLTQVEVAEKTGLSHATISRRLSRPELRAMIQREYEEIVSMAPLVRQVYEKHLRSQPTTDKGEALQVTVAKEVAEMSGMTPTRDTHNNTFLTQIIAPTVVEVSPVVRNAIAKLIGGPPAPPEGRPDYIDVEVQS